MSSPTSTGHRLAARLGAVLVRHRWLVLLGVTVLTLCMVFPLRHLRVGYSVAAFTFSEEPDLREATAHYDEFGVPDNFLHFGYPEPEPFADLSLERLRRLDAAMRRLPGAQQVVTMVSAPALSRDPAKLQKAIADSRTWRGLFVGRGGDAVGGLLMLDRRGFDSTDQRAALIEQVRQLGRREGADIRFAGIPYHRTEVVRMVRADQMLFMPLGAGVTGILLLWLIPSVTMALLALAVVPFTLLATLGAMALAGVDITLLTSTLPILLMCMAVADGVHLVGRFLEERRAGHDPKQAAVRTLGELAFPCFLTSLTTAVGFLTLTFTSVPDLRDLGRFAALGVGFAFIYTVLVMPAALSLVSQLPAERRLDISGAIARALRRLALGPPIRVLAAIGGTLGVAVFLALDIKRDDTLRDDLWPESETRQNLDWYERNFLSMVPSEVLVTTANGFRSDAEREQFAELVDWLEARPAADRSMSLLDLERDGIPGFWAVAVGRLIGILSRDGRTARVLLFQQDQGSAYFRSFADDVAAVAPRFPDLEIRAVGIQVVATTLIHRLTGDLGRSFLGSMFVILLLIWGLFRSLRLGLVAIVPSLVPMFLNLGFMSAVGFAIRPLTVISFCVAFGLAVDDTVHLLARYREERKAGRDRDASLATTLVTAGRPVITTTMLLLIGFLIILTSQFRGTFQFGLLVALALTGSLLGAMIVLPALLRVTRHWGDESARSP